MELFDLPWLLISMINELWRLEYFEVNMFFSVWRNNSCQLLVNEKILKSIVGPFFSSDTNFFLLFKDKQGSSDNKEKYWVYETCPAWITFLISCENTSHRKSLCCSYILQSYLFQKRRAFNYVDGIKSGLLGIKHNIWIRTGLLYELTEDELNGFKECTDIVSNASTPRPQIH